MINSLAEQNLFIQENIEICHFSHSASQVPVHHTKSMLYQLGYGSVRFIRYKS